MAYIQIGVTALRTPDGEFLPSVPLFVETDDLQKSGLTPTSENAIKEIAGFFVEKLNCQNQKKGVIETEKL